MSQGNEQNNEQTNNKQHIELQTYRFLFEAEIVEILSKFAKIHQYDDRKSFKEAWKTWLNEEEIKSIIDEEIGRLTKLGFVGDVLDKMFKSVRYYYRKKTTNTKQLDEDDEEEQEDEEEEDDEKNKKNEDNKNNNNNKKTRKQYDEALPSIIHETMDKHIRCQIVLYTKENKSSISPSNSFDLFCKENQQMFLNQILQNQEQNAAVIKPTITRENITKVTEKFKKTYKNRFYKIRCLMKQAPVE